MWLMTNLASSGLTKVSCRSKCTNAYFPHNLRRIRYRTRCSESQSTTPTPRTDKRPSEHRKLMIQLTKEQDNQALSWGRPSQAEEQKATKPCKAQASFRTSRSERVAWVKCKVMWSGRSSGRASGTCLRRHPGPSPVRRSRNASPPPNGGIKCSMTRPQDIKAL